jgi:hypothetical protein
MGTSNTSSGQVLRLNRLGPVSVAALVGPYPASRGAAAVEERIRSPRGTWVGARSRRNDCAFSTARNAAAVACQAALQDREVVN